MAGTVYAEFFPHEIGTPEEAVEFIIEKARETRRGLPERVDAQVSVHSPYTVDPESSRLAARRTREIGWTARDPPLREPRGGGVRREGPAASPTSSADNEWGGVGVSPVRYARDIELSRPRDDRRAPGDGSLGGGPGHSRPHRCRGGPLPPLKRFPELRRLAGWRG